MGFADSHRMCNQRSVEIFISMAYVSLRNPVMLADISKFTSGEFKYSLNSLTYYVHSQVCLKSWLKNLVRLVHAS